MSIPNITINIPDLGNFWTALIASLIGAVFGALSAYWLNRRSEEQKEINSNISDFMILNYKTYNLKSNLLNFKWKVLLPIKNEFKSLKVGDISIYLQSTIQSVFEFEDELKKYYFLYKLNPSLYSLMFEINRYIIFVHKSIDAFNVLTDNIKTQIILRGGIDEKLTEEPIALIKKLDEDSDNLLYFTDLLFRALDNCNKDYLQKELKNINFKTFEPDYETAILKPCEQHPHILKGWEEIATNGWVKLV